MSYNLCLLSRNDKYQIQLEYEASYWAYQVKKGKKTRDVVYSTILSRSVSETF